MISCANCHHCWENEYGRELGFKDRPFASTLHCRRYPPTVSFDHGNVTQSTTSAWPTVDSSWWCGEFTQKKPTEGPAR